ncbi:MATE family efflux transporter [Raoultibacter timonensis]|uniref:MATE family efflux transporter n=1 Tax=Raoultibacter timonensis TaxID=1907662 RepID=A0ABN6MCW0_9ACTN|nr:MATE family efflux transporter [Raoultibacter timonensis]BDE95811.1 MATE family efflux transporter [Raoultibacter timonensis]BDF50415.1 MATE family efflux transporter [Raoultibacter timonensis]
MITKSMVREYLKYIVPTMLTFTLASVYSIVDGVFVGHAVGDAGLAGINVAFPLVALVMAVGTGIGMGGGVISSIARGAGDDAKSRRAVGTTFLMLIIAAVPIMAALIVLAEPILTALGGRGETLDQAVSYISVIAWGVPFQIFVTGCTPLIRNQGKVAYAMAVQVFAGLMNVALDFVFVILMGWGTAGAAAATVASQIAAFVLVAAFFLLKRNRIAMADLRIDKAIAAHVLKLGMAPFGLTLLPEATVVAINVNAVAYGGETAVAAYAVISYTACVIQMLIQGIGDGSQPLISKHYGQGDVDGVRRFRNTNYLIAVSIGILGLAAMFVFREQIPHLFGASGEAASLIAWALPIFSVAYVFYGFTHASTSYFYAVDDARASSIIVYGEAVLVVLVVFGMARIAGLDGIWVSVTIVQMVLACVAGALLRRRHRSRASRAKMEPALDRP